MPDQNVQNQIEFAIIVGTFAFFFLVSFFILLIVKYNRNLIRKNNQMFKAIIDAGEREKLELSRNLHDQVIPLLAISKLQVESFEAEDPTETNSFKLELTDILSKSIQEIRGICHHSSPMLFNELGLYKSLENFFRQLSHAGQAPAIHFQYDETIVLSRDTELSVYRILLELINNTIKYAAAKDIQINLSKNQRSEILISYKDNGKGVEIVKPGHGLMSIKSRVTLLEGDTQFKSKPAEGFQALIKLPSKWLN
jgi:signal transduction histidine kinase